MLSDRGIKRRASWVCFKSVKEGEFEVHGSVLLLKTRVSKQLENARFSPMNWGARFSLATGPFLVSYFFLVFITCVFMQAFNK